MLECFLLEGRDWVLASSGARGISMGVAGCELGRGLKLPRSGGVSWADHGIGLSRSVGGSASNLLAAWRSWSSCWRESLAGGEARASWQWGSGGGSNFSPGVVVSCSLTSCVHPGVVRPPDNCGGFSSSPATVYGSAIVGAAVGLGGLLPEGHGRSSMWISSLIPSGAKGLLWSFLSGPWLAWVLAASSMFASSTSQVVGETSASLMSSSALSSASKSALTAIMSSLDTLA